MYGADNTPPEMKMERELWHEALGWKRGLPFSYFVSLPFRVLSPVRLVFFVIYDGWMVRDG